MKLQISIHRSFTRSKYLLLSLASHFIQTFQFSTTAATSTSLTKKACIDLLKACKSMAHLKQIQALLFCHGLHQNIDVLHKIMAFTTATSNLSHAERIFYHIENPSLFIYNVMIKAYAKRGCNERTIFLFDELRLRGLWPDNYTYPFVFKAVKGLGKLDRGERIHGFVIKSGVLFDCYVCNSVMDMYGGLGYVQCLSKVFEELSLRDVVSWNVLISGLVKSERFEDAVDVYRRMRKEGNVRPDEATIASTLSACTALKNFDLGKDIHEYVKTEIGFTMIIGNALLDMYAKCGCLDVARGIFDAMLEKNVICWTSMVSAYVNGGLLDEARTLFERSPARDLVLWTAMINGYVQFNCVDEAMALFREMQMARVKPDKFTLVALLTGCAQLGALEQGEWIHTFLVENRILVDRVIGTALIEMYAKCGCLEKSLEIFHSLKEKDTASWTSVICALAMNGRTSKALELFSEMMQTGIQPDDVTFIGVLSACSHGGLVDEGRRYFDSMTNIYHIEPKFEHYGCMIDLLGRAGLLNEAEEIVATIPNKDKNIIVPLYGSLLSACRNYGNVDMGQRIAQWLMKIESSDSSTHTLLANIYASVNRWNDVTQVRRKMRTLGAKKSPGCSLIEFNGNVSESIVG
ncbi:pentatricopeptide repeat-containing At1g31430 [Olea europaea subsp. europaea]|uniref:Pentatricopeptide repeat-containing At1g31430 n=1 Tax=Olea europaea subsp. europaea TaxID=158383 RepID=A0A8S0PD10_OLEEU|nr:pentatricopeptide repeat-containing At1g31430 [Olea europaea subsp. europaea]